MDSKIFQNLRKLLDTSKLVKLYDGKMSVKNYNILLSGIVLSNEIESIENLDEILSYKYNDFNSYNQQIIIYSKLKNLEQCWKILNIILTKYNLVKRKSLYPIIDLMYKNKSNIHSYYDIIVSHVYNFNINLKSDDYCKLLTLTYKSSSFDKIVKYMIDKLIILESFEFLDIKYEIYSKSGDYDFLRKILDDLRLENILITLKKKIGPKNHDFYKWCSNNSDIEIIVDGANVMFYNNNKTINFKRLEHLIGKFRGKKIKIFLYKDHILNLTGLEKKNYDKIKKYIYLTPANINDDLIWLYFFIHLLSLKKIPYFVTNDDLNDHIFKIDNYLNYLKNDYRITYHYNNNSYILNYPNKYSDIVQINKNYIYIPTSKNVLSIKKFNN